VLRFVATAAESLITVRECTLPKASVVIYTRPGCHLCEHAKAAIYAAKCSSEYLLKEVNIETEAGLLERYKNDIPVITIDGVEAFRHRVTAKEFKARINMIR
jgi:glutaredoxin